MLLWRCDRDVVEANTAERACVQPSLPAFQRGISRLGHHRSVKRDAEIGAVDLERDGMPLSLRVPRRFSCGKRGRNPIDDLLKHLLGCAGKAVCDDTVAVEAISLSPRHQPKGRVFLIIDFCADSVIGPRWVA